MKQAVLLAVFIGIILVACSNGASTAVEQAANIDATVSAAVAATRTASDVQEKVAATLMSPPTPTTESASTVNKILDNVLALSENHVTTGVDYFKDGRYEDAIQEFDQAIQLDPDFAIAFMDRGLAYYHLGQHTKAEADFAKARSLGIE